MRKGIHSKINVTQDFQYLGHSIWTICNLWSWFCPKNFPPFYPASHNKPFLYTAETGRMSASSVMLAARRGAKRRSGRSKTVEMVTPRVKLKSECKQGVSDPGSLKLGYLLPVDLIVLQKYSTFLPCFPYWTNSVTRMIGKQIKS